MTRPSRKDLKRAARDYSADRDFDRGTPHVDLSGPMVSISIRLPEKMLVVLKALADKHGLGYQTLIKLWLDERIRTEAESTGSGPPGKSPSLDTRFDEFATTLRKVQDRLATVESTERKVLQLVSNK